MPRDSHCTGLVRMTIQWCIELDRFTTVRTLEIELEIEDKEQKSGGYRSRTVEQDRGVENSGDQAKFHGQAAKQAQERKKELSRLLFESEKENIRHLNLKNSLTNAASQHKNPNELPAEPRRPHQPIQGQVKDLVVNNVNGGAMRQVDAAKNFQIHEQTVRRLIKGSQEKESGLEPPQKKKRGAHSKTTIEMMGDLLTTLEEEPAMTQKNMAEFLKTNYNINVSGPTTSRKLTNLDITWKVVSKVPTRWNKADVI
ncbi:hypothetical protein BY996DRAFT_6499772 [Phakopsora pachyrhizi]|nr:hypothetical protein BY996DRAFT_6499772 [Phakopsora pachyrhizi]